MKRVCIFSAQYLPTVGGVERYTYNIARQLTMRGIKVTIVTSQVSQLPEYEEKEEGTIYRVPCYNLMNGRFPTVKLNSDYRRIMEKLKQYKYDLVITNTRFYLHSLIGVIFGRKYGKRSIVIEHGTSHMSVHNQILDVMEQLFEHAITWFVKKNCCQFYGVSGACLEWLKHFHIQGVGTLYNAVNLEQINQLQENSRLNIREKYYIPENALVISFTGRLLQEKGVLQLQESFQKIREQFPNTYLVMAGDGILFKTLEEKKDDHTILLGQVSFEEVIGMLKDTDIFCLPSVSEGMPTSVLEAIACRNFVITTKRGGAKEILMDSSYGIILSDNSTDLVTKALKKVLDNPEYRVRAVEKSYRKLLQSFTWENVADQIEEELL